MGGFSHRRSDFSNKYAVFSHQYSNFRENIDYFSHLNADAGPHAGADAHFNPWSHHRTYARSYCRTLSRTRSCPAGGLDGRPLPHGLAGRGRQARRDPGDGWQQAAWDAWTFTEYADDRVLDVPEDAEVSYVQWENTVALRMETEAGVTLAWVQDGHSLRLFTASGDAVEMAKSVKKIFEE